MSVLERPVLGTTSAAAVLAPYRSRVRAVVKIFFWPFRYLRSAYSLDLRSLALFRMALGAVLFGDLIARSVDLKVFYTDWGVMPRAALLDNFSPAQRFSLHLWSGQFTFQAILFVIAGIFALMLMFGVRTRLAAFVSWFMVVSVQMRNPAILQGGDVYLRLLAFLAIFLPVGAIWSVDAALDTTPAEMKEKRSFTYFSTPGLALMAQIALLYASAVTLKTAPQWRVDHTAVYYALSIQQLSLPLGRFLLHYHKLMELLTRMTLWEEGGIALLIMCPIFTGPVRFLAALVIFILHISLGLSMRLGHFPFVACTAALPIIPTWFWNRKIVQRWLPWSTEEARHGAGLKIYYDGECPFCFKMVRILRAFLMLPGADVIAAQEFPVTELEMREKRSWIIVTPDSKRCYKWRALSELLSYSPLFAWVAPWMRQKPTAWMGQRFYDVVESNRERLTRWTDWIKPRRMKVMKTSWPVTIFALLFIVYITFWNLSGIVRLPGQPFGDAIGITLGIDQRWDMFAPNPLTYDGWWVIEGVLRDGRHVDVLHSDKPISYEKPASIAATLKDERWRKYLMNLSLREYEPYRLYYARYLCRSWNNGRWPRDGGNLVSFDIIFMGRQNSISDPDRPYSRDLLWHHECFK